jgi:hypothetical protein
MMGGKVIKRERKRTVFRECFISHPDPPYRSNTSLTLLKGGRLAVRIGRARLIDNDVLI